MEIKLSTFGLLFHHKNVLVSQWAQQCKLQTITILLNVKILTKIWSKIFTNTSNKAKDETMKKAARSSCFYLRQLASTNILVQNKTNAAEVGVIVFEVMHSV